MRVVLPVGKITRGEGRNRRRWRRGVTVADALEYGRELEKGSTLHSQRHTATTGMLRKDVDMRTVQTTGHTDTTMAGRYAHASQASQRRPVESLDLEVDH